MKVTIVEKCDRCKREAPREIESTELPAIEARVQEHADKLAEIKAFFDLESGPGEPDRLKHYPDLLVFFKGRLLTIDRICDSNCKTTIEHQLEAMFREIDPTKRAPRKTRTLAETPTETAQSSEENVAENVVEESAQPHHHGNKKKHR